jgi:uncharacterized protein
MDFAPAEPAERGGPGRARPEGPGYGIPEGVDPISMKILIAGGFGAGKTTLVSTLSEITPVNTEAVMSSLSVGIDDAADVPSKSTTTVGLDFGRITVDGQLVLYLFGTPGQGRFWFMWDDVARGAAGGIVVLDLRRIDDSFRAIDFFEARGMPFAVAVNQFPGSPKASESDIRTALSISAEHPVVLMDATDPESSMNTVIALLDHSITS